MSTKKKSLNFFNYFLFRNKFWILVLTEKKKKKIEKTLADVNPKILWKIIINLTKSKKIAQKYKSIEIHLFNFESFNNFESLNY